jgi:membrane-bound ClpP family serine protease
LLAPKPRRGACPGAAVGLAILLLALAGRAAPAEKGPEKQAREGMVFEVPAAITTEATNRLKSLLKGPLDRVAAGGGQFVLVLDFNPNQRRSDCEDFGACLSLARELRGLAKDKGVTTVAFVHGEVKRHSVLPVLACTQTVLSKDPEARLGKVTTGDRPLDKVERPAYEDVLEARAGGDRAALRKMFDAKGEGDTAWYTFADAEKLGINQAELNTLEAVLRHYNVPRTSPRRALDAIVCWRIPVEGEVNGRLRERVTRRVERALRGRANVIVLELRCGNGESGVAHQLGLYLARLNATRPNNPVETIAYVTREARNTAAFLALGCNKIVMQWEPPEGGRNDPEALRGADERGARLGDFEGYLKDHPRVKAAGQERAERLSEVGGQLAQDLVDVAKRQRYPAPLVEGLLRRELVVCQVKGRKANQANQIKSDPGARDFLAFASQKDYLDNKPDVEAAWQTVKAIKEENAYWTLTARQALDYGVATSLVKDFDGLCEVEGVVPQEVRVPDPEWLAGLAEFLCNPWVRVLLVMLGITCLILELKMPGVGLPGVIAAICFVLFFWSHSLAGQFTWLAILLFVLGLVLIGLEVFVLPGFGVAGISGILLVLLGLGLAAYGHWPQGSDEWMALSTKIGPFGLSLLGALAAVAVVVRYLPHIPVLNRLMHRPADEAGEADAEPDYPAHAELAALLGAIGVAATPLRPAGKTQFGDAFVDVVAEGGYIMPGARVQVIEVEGNRVVVKEV